MTHEAFLQEIASGATPLIVCRWEGHPNAPPGTKGGYLCATCGSRLEATPVGQDAIARGGIPLCNKCGISISEAVAAHRGIAGMHVTAHAEASITSGKAIYRERINRLRKAGA